MRAEFNRVRQVHCLLLSAIETGDLPDSVKCVSWGVIFLCSFLYSQSLDFF